MKATKIMGLFAIALMASGLLTLSAANAATIFSDDFESYADTAAMNGVWSNGGSATLDTALGNPGNSMNHPGTSGSFSGGNTNSVSIAPIDPVGAEILSYSVDIYDDGTSANKRASAGIRQASPATNLLEMGVYNNPNHYAYRTVLFGSGDTNWVAFSGLVDDSGASIENVPVAGWHRFNVDITDTSVTFTLDLNADGNINATAVVPVTDNDDFTGYDILRLGGPSDVSSPGGGVNFDNVSLTMIPEPTTGCLLLVASMGLAAIRRR